MNNPILTERDLEFLFSSKGKEKRKQHFKKGLYFAFTPFVFAALLYVALNFNSIGQNLYYWFQFDYMVDSQQSANSNNSSKAQNSTAANGGTLSKIKQGVFSVLNIDNSQDSSQPEEQKNQSTITNNSTAITNTGPKAEEAKYPKPDLPLISNDTLNIPSINVTAPVFWDIQNKPKEVSDTLPNGVIQIAGTSHPGENGNVFITGHSSNYPWIKGDYNSIFALLNKLVAGDIIQVKYNDQEYAYKVSEIKVVQPDNVSVMYPTKEPVLTLMTCTPVGTSLRRLIIVSKQIYPNPANNKNSATSKVQTELLPK